MTRFYTASLIVAVLLPGLAGCLPTKDPYVYNPQTLMACFHSESQEVYNVHTVVPGVLVRGGQPSSRGMRALRDDFGIKTIVNLNNRENKYEAKRAAELGLAYLPLPDDPFDEEEDRELHLALLKAIRSTDRNGPVYVHCATGSDRAGLAVGMYRVIECGWDAPRAIAELRKYQPYYMAVFFHRYPEILREAERDRADWLRRLDEMPDPPIQKNTKGSEN